MQKTTRQGLQSPGDAPLISGTDGESLNPNSLKTSSNVNSPVENYKRLSHSGSGYDVRKDRSMSPKHSVFVLDAKGKPLTPTTPRKAGKLMDSKQAKPVWNKFGCFGIKMLVETRKETPKTALGVDFGTKFEGYAVATGKENSIAIMWKLPDKKKIVRKLKERKDLRRARRQRNCRRRECRSDNHEKEGFIAPSQRVIVQSRLKAMSELFKCYPIGSVAMEDVRFNHRDNKWGKNFSTVEIGKKMINDWIKQRVCLQMFSGYDTQDCREKYSYKKSVNKGAEVFNSHCSDALAIAIEIYAQKHIEQGHFILVDDTYRPVRRRLHDTQFSANHIRYPYSTGNFKGIRKGTICEYGQIVGGTKNNVWIRNSNNKRIGRVITKILWLSHKFKTKTGGAIPLQPKLTEFQDVYPLLNYYEL
ncbi:MAG: RRXRR domain-containing protein [Nanoarchaeota archaeon]